MTDFSLDEIARCAAVLSDRTKSLYVMVRRQGGSRDEIYGSIPAECRYRPLAEIIGALERNTGYDRELIREALWHAGLPRVKFAAPQSLAQKAAGLFK